MIPVLLVLGLALGRWWKTALVLGTVAWPVALLATGTIDASQLLATALLAFINTGVGVAIHQGVLRLVRRIRKQPVLSDHSAV